MSVVSQGVQYSVEVQYGFRLHQETFSLNTSQGVQHLRFQVRGPQGSMEQLPCCESSGNQMTETLDIKAKYLCSAQFTPLLLVCSLSSYSIMDFLTIYICNLHAEIQTWRRSHPTSMWNCGLNPQ